MTFSKDTARRFAAMLHHKTICRPCVVPRAVIGATSPTFACGGVGVKSFSTMTSVTSPNDEHDVLVKEYYRTNKERMSSLSSFGIQNGGNMAATATFARPSTEYLDFATEEEFSTLRRYAFSESYIQDSVQGEGKEQDTDEAATTKLDADHPHSTSSSQETAKHWVNLAALTQDPMIQNVSNHINEVSMRHPFPRTVNEAMNDPRPTVITSSMKPYRIRHVNDAWTSLCGYEEDEAVGKTVEELLHGPHTEKFLARELVGKQLRQDSYSHAVVTNYTKQGRKFMNLVQVSDMYDPTESDGEENLFVAILQEVSNDGYQLEETKTMMGGASS